jgi:hypothetical protein
MVPDILNPDVQVGFYEGMFFPGMPLDAIINEPFIIPEKIFH